MKEDKKIDMEAIEIGKRIKKARLSFNDGNGMTQKQLGELCGINEANIRKYESGRQRPKYSTIERIASALNVAPGYLQGIKGEDVMYALRSLNNYETDSERSREESAKWLCKYSGLKPGSIIPLAEDEKKELEKQIDASRKEREIYLNRICFLLKVKYNRFTKSDYNILNRLIVAFCSLNDKGQQKAVDNLEDLSKILEYQKKDDSNAQDKDNP